MSKKKKEQFNAKCAAILRTYVDEAVGERIHQPENALRLHMYLSGMFLSYVSLAFHCGDGLAQEDLTAMSCFSNLLQDYYDLLSEANPYMQPSET